MVAITRLNVTLYSTLPVLLYFSSVQGKFISFRFPRQNFCIDYVPVSPMRAAGPVNLFSLDSITLLRVQSKIFSIYNTMELLHQRFSIFCLGTAV